MLAPCKEGVLETVLKHGIPSARPLDESGSKRLGNGGPRGASFGRRNRGGRAAASGRYRWPLTAELPLHYCSGAAILRFLLFEGPGPCPKLELQTSNFEAGLPTEIS